MYFMSDGNVSSNIIRFSGQIIRPDSIGPNNQEV